MLLDFASDGNTTGVQPQNHHTRQLLVLKPATGKAPEKS
jgi:hypothetical protein